jgi:hypothetical protein
VTLTTLVTGAHASAREAAISEAIDTSYSTALILEGLPDGTAPLESINGLTNIHIARIAPGCPCCTGNLTMRVTLNRILRRPPTRLFISLVSADHLEQIRRFLQQPPYDNLLTLTEDLQVRSSRS